MAPEKTDKTLTEAEFARRARALEWLLFDVDGVLTNGVLYYTGDGEQLKTFHVRDGLAFRLAQRAGLRLGLLSGRRSPPLECRARELDFDVVIVGSGDKGRDFDQFLAEHGTTAERVAFVGDDLPDLPVLRRCGLAFAPNDADPEVLRRADVVLATRGGAGAARELVERVLRARGDWQSAVSYFVA